MIFTYLCIILLIFFFNCKEKEKQPIKSKPVINKGIGPIQDLQLNEVIDTAMAKKGEELFNLQCSSCHKLDERYIGPELGGVVNRRAPEWIMNFMLNTDEMLEKDPIAKQLVAEYITKMIQPTLEKEEVRSILEYLRMSATKEPTTTEQKGDLK